MFDPSGDPQYNPRNYSRAQASAWTVYTRLLGYAWEYKARLFVSLLFAVVVSASFGGMILSAGYAVKIILGDEDEVAELTAHYTEMVASYQERMEAAVGWAPQDAALRFENLIWDMRADPMQGLAIVGGVLIVLAVAGALARFVQEYYAGSIGASICVGLGERMYRNILGLSLAFFEKRDSGEIIARFTNDIFMVNRGLASVLVKLLREPLKVVLFLAIALWIDPFLTLVGLCVLPPAAYAIVTIGKKVKRSMRRSLEKIAAMAGVASESFRAISIVKAFGMENYVMSRVEGEFGKLRRYLLKLVKLNAAAGPITEVLLTIGIVAFILVSGRRVIAGDIDGGDLVMLYGALAAMLDPIRKLSTVNNLIQSSIASAERVFEFMDEEPDVKEAPDAVELKPLQHELRFDNVRFSYDGERDVLCDLNVSIGKGEMVALVGSSGAGKSTLIKLIPRFYDVTGGALTFDGIDIRTATLASVRNQIGMVTQDTVLFNQSIRENIRFGNPAYGNEQVEAAARAAYAHAFIEELPQGYDTPIGESGVFLSGGQRQRIAIARALLKDPAILILDEATSSLDSESERMIQQAIDAFVVGRTSIVIAHRLSTIQRANRILVLDEGRIVEEGPHKALLAQGGLYCRLYETQFADPSRTETA